MPKVPGLLSQACKTSPPITASNPPSHSPAIFLILPPEPGPHHPLFRNDLEARRKEEKKMGPSIAQGAANPTAQLASIAVKPTYMGFRVYP
jgi:hypothetical protein